MPCNRLFEAEVDVLVEFVAHIRDFLFGNNLEVHRGKLALEGSVLVRVKVVVRTELRGWMGVVHEVFIETVFLQLSDVLGKPDDFELVNRVLCVLLVHFEQVLDLGLFNLFPVPRLPLPVALETQRELAEQVLVHQVRECLLQLATAELIDLALRCRQEAKKLISIHAKAIPENLLHRLVILLHFLHVVVS